jgi:hypothetical protein
VANNECRQRAVCARAADNERVGWGSSAREVAIEHTSIGYGIVDTKGGAGGADNEHESSARVQATSKGSGQRVQEQRAAGSKRWGRPATSIRAAASEHDGAGSEREGGGQRTLRAAGNEHKIGGRRAEGRRVADNEQGGGGERA